MRKQCWALVSITVGCGLVVFQSIAPKLTTVMDSIDTETFAVRTNFTNLVESNSTVPLATTTKSVRSPVNTHTKSGLAKDVDFAQEVDLPTVNAPVQLKVPTPVFVLSLPKSGTTTTHSFFKCGLGKRRSTHHWFKNATGGHDRLGVCMGENVRAGRPLLQSCQDFHVYSDVGAIWSTETQPRQHYCYYPSIHGLDDLASNYPSATIIVVRRNATQWASSASKWNNLLGRISTFCEGVPPVHATLDDWAAFYTAHNQRVRDYAEQQPGWRFFEYQLESPTIGEELETDIGIPASCWGHCLPNNRCYQAITNTSNATG